MFVDTDLSEVKDLDTCKHRGPSFIDHQTLAKSGPLPLAGDSGKAERLVRKEAERHSGMNPNTIGA
jgi:hypothetical protein